MSFITILVPAVMAALGLHIIVNSIGIRRDITKRNVMLSIGTVLLAAGFYFQFLVSPVGSTEILMRAIVTVNAAAVVVSTEVMKGIEASCGRHSGMNVCSAVFNAKSFRIACSVMALIVASMV